MSATKISTLLAVVVLTGCKSYVGPFDDTSLPAREVVTVGGQTLEAKDGKLIQRVGPLEIGHALGVELDEDERGIVVGRVVRAKSPFRAEDRIVFVGPRIAGLSNDEGVIARLEPAARRARLAEIDRDRALELQARGVLRAGRVALTDDETAVVRALWSLEIAERVFRAGYFDKASKDELGTLETLARAGLIDSQLGAGRAFGYSFVCGPKPEDDKSRWYVMATPIKPIFLLTISEKNQAHFYMNESGAVFSARAAFRVDNLGWGGVANGVPLLCEAPPVLPAPAELRGQPRGTAVKSIADLQRYAFAEELELVVERGGKEVVVRGEPEDESAVVPVVPFRVPAPNPEDAWPGVDLVSVRDLPPGLYPTYATKDDVLVTRVAQGSPAAIAGLRPLDVISAGQASGASDTETSTVTVRSATGTRILYDLQRGVVRHFWIPFVGVVEYDRVRTHVGLGPLDAVFHYSSKKDYSPDSDAYVETRRWSLATTIVHRSVTGPSGTRTTNEIAIADGARLDYCSDWIDTK